MNDTDSTLQSLKDRVGSFTAERDWTQFHDLKNLSMAIATEAAEIMEHFRWVPNVEANQLMSIPDSADAIQQEVADVLLLLAEFANVAKIDLMAAAERKLAINESRYPVCKSKGTATKYNKL